MNTPCYTSWTTLYKIFNMLSELIMPDNSLKPISPIFSFPNNLGGENSSKGVGSVPEVLLQMW